MEQNHVKFKKNKVYQDIFNGQYRVDYVGCKYVIGTMINDIVIPVGTEVCFLISEINQTHKEVKQ